MKKFISFVFVILVMYIPIYADYNIDTSKVDKALDSKYRGYINNQDTQNADFEKGAKSLFENGIVIARQKLKESCKVCFVIVICSALISLVKGFSNVSGSKLVVKAADYTGTLTIVCVAMYSAGGMIDKCIQAINDINIFSKIVTPVFAVAAAVSKHPATAVTTAGAAMLFTSLFTTITLELFIPMIVAYMVVASIGAISELDMLSKLCECIKWFLGWSWKILLITFIGYISVSGMVSSTTDAVSLKTAKMVINSTVPVIGGIIADASDTILSGAVLVKNSVGIIGFLGVCAICLVPFVGCFIYQIVFKITSAVSASLGGGAVTKVLDSIGCAYGLALAALGSCSAVQFVSLIIMSAVTMV